MVPYTESYDHVVIGAGPAGLQLGWALEKAGRDYVILEAADTVGAFFTKLPRSRGLVSYNRVCNLYDDPELFLRGDWNSLLCDGELRFSDYSQALYPSADELVAYLRDFADHFDLRIQLDTSVEEISRGDDGAFVVRTSRGTISGRSVVIATGVSAPYVPQIPGIDLVTEAYENVSLDAADFEGQRVLVIGKGNSALEFVEEIIDGPTLIHVASPNSIRFAWDTRHPGHARANYLRLMDTYQLKLLSGSLDCTIDAIAKDGDEFVVDVTYSHADGETETLVYDRVVRATGFAFDDSVLSPDCRPDRTHRGRLPAMTSAWEAEGVPDLWFAGTLMQTRDFKKTSSAFIGGFRYNIRTLAHFLDARYHDEDLPTRPLPVDVEALTEATLARVCRSSGLWLQFGYLCDLLVVDTATGVAHYLEDLPVDLVDERRAELGETWFRITFEWGEGEGDVFAVQRHPNHGAADQSRFLHPIIRRFDHETLVEEHHLLEDLFGMYRASGVVGAFRSKNGRTPEEYHVEEHEQPLRDFYDRHLEMSGRTSRTFTAGSLTQILLAEPERTSASRPVTASR